METASPDLSRVPVAAVVRGWRFSRLDPGDGRLLAWDEEAEWLAVIPEAALASLGDEACRTATSLKEAIVDDRRS